jgi:hypothetical protein
MTRQKLISLFSAMAVLIFLLTLTSSVFAVEPTTFPTNRTAPKIKKTVPTPAPPVLVAPTKTKAPAHKPAVSAGTRKPAPPKVSVKQPKPSTPKVSVKKPNRSAPKALTAPASLPPSIVRRGLPDAHIPRDLGKAVNIQRDLGKTNSISGRMPAGHNTPAAGFGSTGGAAGLAKGVGQRDGVGSVKDEFSHLTGPRFVQGDGSHIQGQETGEQQNQKQPDEMTFTEEESKADYDAWKKTYDAVLEDPSETAAGDPTWATVAERKKADELAVLLMEDPKSERMVDEGPTDGTPDIRHINSDKMKGIFAGSPGIRFAPGEESAGGGPVDPGRLSEIQSSQTQIHTFEGGVPESSNFEDLSKKVQDAIKSGGQGNPIIE